MQLHRKFLRKIPTVDRQRFGYEAHMKLRPSGVPRHVWARQWAALHGLVGKSEVIPVEVDPAYRKKPRKAKQKFSARKEPDHYHATDAFLQSYEWRRLRLVVLKKYGARCQCCGASPKDGIVIHVDHIKPRRLFPELALTESNLQVLCEVCNHGKGNWDQTDWRPEAPKPTTSPLPDDWNVPMWTKRVQ